MGWLEWLKEYYFFNFFALYILGGRTAALLSAQWLGQSLLFFFPPGSTPGYRTNSLVLQGLRGTPASVFSLPVQTLAGAAPGGPPTVQGLADRIGLERPGGLSDHPGAGQGRGDVERRPDGFFAENFQTGLLPDPDQRFGGRVSAVVGTRENPRVFMALINRNKRCL